ncbi:MAG: S26 family signal peptidase [Bacillales bacterium]|nr:S26 family signal peptidase [Bacillales bacterium]
MAKKEKKQLSPKVQKIVDTVTTVVEVILIAVCLVISIFVIANPGGVKKDNNGKISGNVNLVPVLSNSMDPTFKKNDLIFGEKIENKDEILDIGTVIMFLQKNPDGTFFINTHRIIGYSASWSTADNKGSGNDISLPMSLLYPSADGTPESYAWTNAKFKTAKELKDYVLSDSNYTAFNYVGYITKGDNNSIYYSVDKDGNQTILATYDEGYRSFNDVIGLVKTNNKGEIKRVAVLGGVVNWMHDPLHFGLIIMIPLVLLFGYNIYIVIKYIMEQKVKKAQQEALANSAPVLDEEEIKRKAIEEYLAMQASLKNEEDKKKE